MNTLIIYAHPHHDGHCGQLLKSVEEELTSRGKEFELLDLYAMEFNPILTKEDLLNVGNPPLTQERRELQKQITDAHSLIIIYPNWWQSTPAILKGFFDTILTTGFAFEYGDNGMPVGLLKGKKAVILTTAGAPRALTKALWGDMSVRAVEQTTLKFCGIKTKAFPFGGARHLSENREALQKLSGKALKFLFD